MILKTPLAPIGERQPTSFVARLWRLVRKPFERMKSVRSRLSGTLAGEEPSLSDLQSTIVTLSNCSPSGMFIADDAGQYVYVNERWSALTGWPAALAKGEGWLDAVHPDDRKLIFSQWKGLLEGQPFLAEYRFLRPDRTVRTVVGHAVPRADRAGLVQGYVGTITDITDYKRLEEGLLLMMFDGGTSLPKFLTSLATMVESQMPDVLCSILLLDDTGEHFQVGAAPRLSWQYEYALTTASWSADMGAPDLSTYFKRPVFIEEIGSQPLYANRGWGSVRDSLRALGLHSALSHPVLSSHGHLLGTINFFWRRRCTEPNVDETWIDMVARTVRQAIERNQAEESLRKSDQRYRSLLETVGTVLIALSSDHRVLEWNFEAQRVFGYKREDAIGKKFVDLCPTDEDSIARGARELFAGNVMRKCFESSVRSLDGSIRVVLWNITPLLGAEHKVIGVLASGQDITQRKKDEEVLCNLNKALEQGITERTAELSDLNHALLDDIAKRKATETELRRVEEVLRDSEQRYRQLVDQANDIIYRTDARGHFVFVNPTVTRVMQYDPAELVGRRFTELIRADARQAAERFYSLQFVRHRPTTYYEFPAIKKDGAEVWIGQNVQILEEGGAIVGFQAVARDVTELRRAQEELQRAKMVAESANEAKTEFLATMSHEIRTPMNAILGMADLLAEGRLTAEQEQYVGMLKRAGGSLLGLIDDVLDLSKAEAGLITLERRSFNLYDAVDAAIEMVALRSAEKGIEVTCHIDGDVPVLLEGDAFRLRQVLINLLGNAVKFTEQGEINLRVARGPGTDEPRHLRFSVSDTGIGIPADKLTHIFERFTQADSSTSRKYGGTGLGLTICKRLVELMRGRIWVESRVGQGSTFSFTAQFGMVDDRKGRPVPWAACKGWRVLVVDDNASSRSSIRHTLTRWGCTVVERSDGKAGLADIVQAEEAGTPYDVILLDQRMPGMPGLDVFRRLAGCPVSRGRVVLMLTAHHHAANVLECQTLGVKRYLNKPIRKADLLASLTTDPVATRPDPEPTKPSAEGVPALRLLLVEDSEVNQLLVQSYLKGTPCAIDVAENGHRAVELYRRGLYDIVLMDIQMPDLDGLEATRAIRAWERGHDMPATPIIALSANALPEEVAKALDAGCDSYLAKPIKKDLLLTALAEGARRRNRSIAQNG